MLTQSDNAILIGPALPSTSYSLLRFCSCFEVEQNHIIMAAHAIGMSAFTPAAAPKHKLPHHFSLWPLSSSSAFIPFTERRRARRQLWPVKASQLDVDVDLEALLSRAQGFLYTLADAAVAASDTVVVDSAAPAKKSGWFSFLADGLEGFLKVLKDGLTTIHVPYAYGFAIITLTVLVKIATFPLTKKQVESTIAMQNLQPKVKAIQSRYEGDKERIQLEIARLYKQAGVNPLAGCLPTLATMPVWIGLYNALSNVANEGLLTEGFFWVPSLAGPTTIAARQNGSGISWLLPFVDGHPPLGWSDTFAYLVLPTLLITSQYLSMKILQPQVDDPTQKNTQIALKFLPLMLGYFSLSVPSGLSLYWFTNNILSIGQQIWLRKLGGANPVVNKDANGIITAGQAKRPALIDVSNVQESERSERRRKAGEARQKKNGRQTIDANMEGVNELSASSIAKNGDYDIENQETQKLPSESENEPSKKVYVASGSGASVSTPTQKRSKRSKRKRTARRS